MAENIYTFVQAYNSLLEQCGGNFRPSTTFSSNHKNSKPAELTCLFVIGWNSCRWLSCVTTLVWMYICFWLKNIKDVWSISWFNKIRLWIQKYVDFFRMISKLVKIMFQISRSDHRNVCHLKIDWNLCLIRIQKTHTVQKINDSI